MADTILATVYDPSIYSWVVDTCIYGVVGQFIINSSVAGREGPTGPQGPEGSAGYTPIKGIDYFDGSKGDKGDKGDTGPSFADTSLGFGLYWNDITHLVDVSIYSEYLRETSIYSYATNSSVNIALRHYATNASVNLAFYSNASLGLVAVYNLGPYATNSSVNNALITNVSLGLVAVYDLGPYATNASVNLAIKDFATNSSVNIALRPYATNASVNLAFITNPSLGYTNPNFATNASVNNAFITNTSLGLAFNRFTNASLGLAFSQYTNASLGLAFNQYTNASLGLANNSYATNASVNIALRPYATNSSVGTAIKDFATNASVNNALISKLNDTTDTFTGVLTINGSLYLIGDLYQDGSSYVVKVQNLDVSSNFINLRVGSIAAIPDGSISGLKIIKANGTNNVVFGTGSDAVLRIGWEGDLLEAIATREDIPTNNWYAYWDNSSTMFKTYDLKGYIDGSIRYFATNSSVNNAFITNVSLGLVGTSVSSLNELTDVSIVSVLNNQVLAYDTATTIWKNKAAVDLSVYDVINASDYFWIFADVSLTSPTNNQALVYNTTYGLFTNKTLADPSIFDIVDGSLYYQSKITMASPSTNGAGSQGDWSFDASYLYICTSTNKWMRILGITGY